MSEDTNVVTTGHSDDGFLDRELDRFTGRHSGFTEDWTLTRDPRETNTSGEDQKLTLSGQWFVAHRGWVVSKIEPVAGSSDGQPSLLT